MSSTITIDPQQHETTREEPLAVLHTNASFSQPKPNGHWPTWFEEEQQAAWEEFLATPAPKRTDENWRFSRIAALDLAGFHPAGLVANESELLQISQGLEKVAAKFVIANNRMIAREVIDLPKGVLALPLEEAARKHEDLFRSYFMRQPVELGSHKYAKLHQAHLRSGFLLYVPPNTTIELPIEIFHWVEGENAAVFPHTLVILGENSSATVIDHFGSADGKRAFACGVNDLHLSDGAKLSYFALQNWSNDSLAFHLNSTIVSKDAVSTALSLNFGGKFVRGESLSKMTDSGAHSVMLSMNPVDGNRMIDQRTLQLHSSAGATSDLLYHNVLDDEARTIFAGLIKVDEGAHRTDAYQKVRNLLLSDEVEANSMPGLEILADDVKCSHGATSGELSEDELFYLAARGIPSEEGKRLLVLGFFHTLLERVADPALREFLSQKTADRLSGSI